VSPPIPREGRLAVYLEGEQVGTLEDRTLGYVAFRFDRGFVDRYGRGSRALSVGIPTQTDVLDPLEVTPFFAGLLPEGEALNRLAGEFRLDPADTYGLLAALGRECAGALVIVPEGSLPPAAGGVRWLAEAELARALRDLAEAPLGVRVDDETVRLSLAGA
jgi:serine/threonine-protein kinase HipA